MLAAPLVSLADTTYASPTPTPSTKAEAHKEKEKENKAEREAKKLAEQKDRILKFWNKMSHRLSILIRDQQRLADRIEKRINKMAADGKDVTSFRAQLATARTAITEAQSALDNAKSLVADAIANNDAKTALKKVQDINKDVLAKIKVAHKDLVDLIKSMSAATPTPTPTPTP